MENQKIFDPAMTGDRANEFAGEPKVETMRGLMEQRALESVVFLGEALSRVPEEKIQGDAFTVVETILAQEGKTFYGEDGVKKRFSREREAFYTCFLVARKYADVERGIKRLHVKRESLNENEFAEEIDRIATKREVVNTIGRREVTDTLSSLSGFLDRDADKMADFVNRFQQFAQYIWEQETETDGGSIRMPEKPVMPETGGSIRPSTSS